MPEKVGWVIGRYRARLETPPDQLTEREPHLRNCSQLMSVTGR